MDRKLWSQAEILEEYFTGDDGMPLAACEPRRRHLKEPVASPSSEQPLHLACLSGDLETVKRLASESPLLLREPDRVGLFPIRLAMIGGHIDIVEFLVDFQGSSLRFLVDSFHFDPLQCAIWYRAPSIAKKLIEDPRFGFDISFDSDQCPLELAAKTGDIELVKYLLDIGMDPSKAGRNVPATPIKDLSHWVMRGALAGDRLEVFKECYIPRRPAIYHKQSLGIRVLERALVTGAKRIITYLLEDVLLSWCGPNRVVLELDLLGKSKKARLEAMEAAEWRVQVEDFVAHHAAGAGALSVLKWLVAKDKRGTLVVEAAAKENCGEVTPMNGHQTNSIDWNNTNPNPLLSHPAVVHKSDEPATPLARAVIEEKLEVIQFLARETSSDPFLIHPDGETPLSNAITCAPIPVIEFLLSLRPESVTQDPHLRILLNPSQPKTSLSLLRDAVRSRSCATVEWIINAGLADINHVEPDGVTPLMQACYKLVCPAIIETLLRHGADPLVAYRGIDDDYSGATAFWFALKSRDLNAMKLLFGRNPDVLWNVHPRQHPLAYALETGQLEAAQWLVSVDTNMKLLERQNGRKKFSWPGGGNASLQPVFKWQRPCKSMYQTHAGQKKSLKLETEVKMNPAVKAVLFKLVSPEAPKSTCAPILAWLHSLGFDLLNAQERRRDSMITLLDAALTQDEAARFLAKTVNVEISIVTLEDAIEDSSLETVDCLMEVALKQRPKYDWHQLRKGWNLAGHAVYHGRADVLKLLYNKYKAKRVRLMDFSLWEIIATGGSIEIWNFFVQEKRAKPKSCARLYNSLYCAMEHNSLDMLKFLFQEVGLTIEEDDSMWLAFAISWDTKPEIISWMHEYGFSLKPEFTTKLAEDHFVTTRAVQAATMRGNLPVLKWLLSAGLSVHTRDDYGLTPLHYACSRGELCLVKYLIQQGAENVSQAGKPKKTPRFYAERSSHTEIIEFFDKIGWK